MSNTPNETEPFRLPFSQKEIPAHQSIGDTAITGRHLGALDNILDGNQPADPDDNRVLNNLVADMKIELDVWIKSQGGYSSIEQRPAADALAVDLNLRQLEPIHGGDHDNTRSTAETSTAWQTAIRSTSVVNPDYSNSAIVEVIDPVYATQSLLIDQDDAMTEQKLTGWP